MIKRRNFHQLSIIKKQAQGATCVVPSKKLYSRKVKHKARGWI